MGSVIGCAPFLVGVAYLANELMESVFWTPPRSGEPSAYKAALFLLLIGIPGRRTRSARGSGSASRLDGLESQVEGVLPMIGVFATFRYSDNFDEQAVRKIAETARAKFDGMPGLRSKAFTVNAAQREATNFYVWDSEDAARGSFTDALVDRITGLYGVRPSVEFVEVATLVESAHAS